MGDNIIGLIYLLTSELREGQTLILEELTLDDVVNNEVTVYSTEIQGEGYMYMRI